MINSIAIHTTGQVALSASSIATGKIQIEQIGAAFFVTRILGKDTLPYIKFKITGEPGNNLISDDFISMSPYSAYAAVVNPSVVPGYSRKCGRPIFACASGSTLNVTFKNDGSTDVVSCIGLVGFYVNERGQRYNDGNIPLMVLNRLV